MLYKVKMLAEGNSFVTSEKGNSMTPLIKSGQKHVLSPVTLDKVEVEEIPYSHVYLLVCTKCGKLKQVKMKPG